MEGLKIEGYSQYLLVDGCKVYNIKKNKFITISSANTGHPYCKVKNDNGQFKGVSLSTMQYLAGISCIPLDACVVPYSNKTAYVTKEGRVFSTILVKCGQELKPDLDSSGYLRVSIHFKGKERAVNVHQLMCRTFYDADYVEKGLVCLHLDNDKTNCTLTNLKVGTYSENNKQAYGDGLNQGNILGINQYTG